MFVVIWLFVCRVVVGFSVGFGVVGFADEGVGFGIGAKAVKMRGFIDEEGLALFGVDAVVDAETSTILLIAINAADEVGDTLACVVVDVVVCCCSGCCCRIVVCCCGCGWVVVCCCCCCC